MLTSVGLSCEPIRDRGTLCQHFILIKIMFLPLTILRFLSSIFGILNIFPLNKYIHCNMAKGLREDICVCEAACMHMYLGHPTDNVQIESLKKYDARKQSPTTVRLLLDQHKAARRHM